MVVRPRRRFYCAYFMCRIALLASLISIKTARHMNTVIRSVEGNILTIWPHSCRIWLCKKNALISALQSLMKKQYHTNMDASNQLVSN